MEIVGDLKPTKDRRRSLQTIKSKRLSSQRKPKEASVRISRPRGSLKAIRRSCQEDYSRPETAIVVELLGLAIPLTTLLFILSRIQGYPKTQTLLSWASEREWDCIKWRAKTRACNLLTAAREEKEKMTKTFQIYRQTPTTTTTATWYSLKCLLRIQTNLNPRTFLSGQELCWKICLRRR